MLDQKRLSLGLLIQMPQKIIFPYFTPGIAIKFLLNIFSSIFEVQMNNISNKRVFKFEKSIFLKDLDNKFAIEFVR